MEVERFLLTKKLAVDFLSNWPLRTPMDTDKRDLVIQLATRAGILMEGCSTTAVTLISQPDGDLASTIQKFEAQVGKMASLLEAARGFCE